MDLVDWELATRTARTLVRPGPELTPAQAADVVRELRALSAEALTHVVVYTGLEPDARLRTTTEVIDRPTWVAYNVRSMRRTLAPLLDRLAERREQRLAEKSTASTTAPTRAWMSSRLSVTSTRTGQVATGTEVGSVLAFLASRILGQYEALLAAGEGDGRLLLVAPNIVEAERRLGVDPRDFRMWVCVHEQTHHVQFTAAPWLQTHIADLIGRLAANADIEPRAVLDRLRTSIRDRERERGNGPLALLQSPAQRQIVGEIQALMTLLEGHADQVMDAVGPQVIPSVAQIRGRFEQRRREGASPVDRLFRRLLGIDAKLAQYRVGGAFCRAVTEQGGPAAMRVAFAGPEFLPSMAELEAPEQWLARTVGART